jgi:hypothetical protein
MTVVSGNSAGNFLLGRVPPKTKARVFFSTYVLDAADAATLFASARADARRYVYNAVLSFLSGMAGLRTQQATWAVTKMYYTGFYIGRAALSRAGRVIFHVEKEAGNGYTQYEIQVRAGEQVTVVSDTPSTHKLVALRFRQIGYPVFMRGLNIDGTDPLMWLMDQREYWQYRAARFSDPDLPSILEEIDPDKVQRLLAEYANDPKGIFLADPAHAVISIPFRLVAWALSVESLISPGVVDVEDVNYIRKRCCMGKQRLNANGQYLS